MRFPIQIAVALGVAATLPFTASLAEAQGQRNGNGPPAAEERRVPASPRPFLTPAYRDVLPNSPAAVRSKGLAKAAEKTARNGAPAVGLLGLLEGTTTTTTTTR